MPPSDPGHSAAVLVAFAIMGDWPSQTSDGKVSSVPPPATEFTMPAAKAAANAAIQWRSDTEETFRSFSVKHFRASLRTVVLACQAGKPGLGYVSLSRLTLERISESPGEKLDASFSGV